MVVAVYGGRAKSLTSWLGRQREEEDGTGVPQSLPGTPPVT
jgi:hypothetical protein